MSDNRSVEDVQRELAEAIKRVVFVEPDMERDEARDKFSLRAAMSVMVLAVEEEMADE